MIRSAFTARGMWVALAVLVATSATALSAHVEVGELGDRPRPQVVPPPPPAPGSPVAAFVAELVVHRPVGYRGLTVFPLTLRRVRDAYDYATLDESVHAGWLVVTERGAGTVPQVMVQNTSSRTVFLMAGELIAGGKQNRIIADDVLVPPYSPPIPIAVRCIEQGRWHGRSPKFKAQAGVAPQSVRRQAQTGASQEQVWSEVRHRLRAMGQTPAGEDLAAAVRSPAVQGKLAEYVEAIVPGLPRQCVGVVVAQGVGIVGTDAFANWRVFSKLRRKVLHAYALDVLSPKPIPSPYRSPAVWDVQRFLNRAAGARLAYVATPGAGRLARLSGVAWGSALMAHAGVVHLSLAQPIVRPLQPR